jgi:hypothetical protein
VVRLIAPCSGVQHTAADVGADHFPRHGAEAFGKHHRETVGLFTTRAGGAPDPVIALGYDCLFCMLPQQFRVAAFAKKVRLVGGQQINGRLHLLRSRPALQQAEVRSEVAVRALLHTAHPIFGTTPAATDSKSDGRKLRATRAAPSAC